MIIISSVIFIFSDISFVLQGDDNASCILQSFTGVWPQNYNLWLKEKGQ